MRHYVLAAVLVSVGLLGVLGLFIWLSTQAFFHAVHFKDVGAARRWLRLRPGLANAQECHESAALNVAVERNDLEMVELLIASGADVNHASLRLGTPLYSAAGLFGGVEIVKVLVEGGADVNRQPARFWETPLHVAVATWNVESAAVLLQAGAQVNSRDGHGATPLHNAVVGVSPESRQQQDIVRLLLGKGALVNAKDNTGKTPLYYLDNYNRNLTEAESRMLVEVRKLLLDRGAVK